MKSLRVLLLTSPLLAFAVPHLLPATLQAPDSGELETESTAKKLREAERIELRTTDDVEIIGNFYQAAASESPRPALLLLHGGNRYKERWVESGFVQAYAGGDYHLLAIDIRGRGESEEGDAQALSQDLTLPYLDIEASLDWLIAREDVDRDHIALVGSSYGANLASSGMRVRDWPVCTLVCFSATGSAYRFLIGKEIKNDLPSGLYLASAGEVERYGSEAIAYKLAEDTAGEYEVHIYNGPVHAQVLFAIEPSVPLLVEGWLEEQFSDPTGWSAPK